MQNLIAQQAAQTGIAISMLDLLLALTISVVVSLGVVVLYRYTHRGLNYERPFLVSMVTIAPIVCVVMMLIGSNLALSLGMVGALSIIRFRTVIKDTRDMVYLFWMIAIGLGAGTHNYMTVVVSAGFIAVVLLALHFIGYAKAAHSDYVLVVAGKGDTPQSQIRDVVKKHSNMSQLRSLDLKDKNWEFVFEVRLFKDGVKGEEKMLSELKEVKAIDKVSLLAPQLALPL